LADGRDELADAEPGKAADTLRAALALWRGPALAEVAYMDFARAESERLAELKLEALEERIEADLALGRHGAVVADLEQLAGEHPLREQLLALLMPALYRCGRLADANTAALVGPDGRIATEIPVGDSPAHAAIGGGFLWTSNERDGTVSRVDRADRSIETVPVGRSPEGLAFADGYLWVAVGGE